MADEDERPPTLATTSADEINKLAPTLATLSAGGGNEPAVDTVAEESAMTRALNTTELLEVVLLEVDMKTVLLAQRVSKRWEDTIKESPGLQEKLWFRMPAKVTQNTPWQANPLVFTADAATREDALLFLSPVPLDFRYQGSTAIQLPCENIGMVFCYAAIYDLPQGSWQKMMLEKGGRDRKKLLVVYRSITKTGYTDLKTTVRGESGGCTVGQVVDAMKTHVDEEEMVWEERMKKDGLLEEDGMN